MNHILMWLISHSTDPSSYRRISYSHICRLVCASSRFSGTGAWCLVRSLRCTCDCRCVVGLNQSELLLVTDIADFGVHQIGRKWNVTMMAERAGKQMQMAAICVSAVNEGVKHGDYTQGMDGNGLDWTGRWSVDGETSIGTGERMGRTNNTHVDVPPTDLDPNRMRMLVRVCTCVPYLSRIYQPHRY